MRRRTAFTLIELLAASALAAVLMLVMFQVIGSLGRTRAALSRASDDAGRGSAVQSPWKSDLLDALRWDLANAATAKLEANRVTLAGHGSLDRRTLAASHEPVEVTYRLERRGAGGRTCLVRREVPRGAATNDRGWSELLCADVSRFAVEPVRSAGLLGLRRDALAGPLRVRLDGPGGVLVDEVIVVK